MAGDNNKKGKGAEIKSDAEVNMTEGSSAVAREAEQFVATLSARIAEDAEKKAQELLRDYEEKIESLVVESREELMTRSMEVSDSIRQAIIQKARETSSGLVEKIVAGKNEKAAEMAQKLKGAAIIEEPAEPKDVPLEESKDSVEIAQEPAEDEVTAEVKPVEDVAEDSDFKPTEADFKQARVAAELDYKIDNLGADAEAAKEMPAGEDGKQENDVKAEASEVNENSTEPQEKGEGDIDDFVRYLSQ